MGSPDSPSLSEVDSHLVSHVFQSRFTTGGIAALVGCFPESGLSARSRRPTVSATTHVSLKGWL